MSGNISHAGYTLLISASKTTNGVPVPFLETTDDTDPLIFEDIEMGDMVLDTNGNPIYWSKASPINMSYSITPSTVGYEVLMRIVAANTTTADHKSVNDEIAVYRLLPNGSAARVKKGRFISAPPAESQSQGGRLKTGTFKMRFASIDRAPSLDAFL